MSRNAVAFDKPNFAIVHKDKQIKREKVSSRDRRNGEDPTAASAWVLSRHGGVFVSSKLKAGGMLGDSANLGIRLWGYTGGEICGWLMFDGYSAKREVQ